MSELTVREMLEELRQFDTPSITTSSPPIREQALSGRYNPGLRTGTPLKPSLYVSCVGAVGGAMRHLRLWPTRPQFQRVDLNDVIDALSLLPSQRC
jgi:hypothetical protein